MIRNFSIRENLKRKEAKKMKKLFLLLVFSVAIMLFASNAIALPIEGSTSGIFINPVGPGVPTWTTGVGTSNFNWGNGAPYGSPPSSMSFAGATVATDFNTLFSFGTLGYFNGTIYPDTQATAVDLSVTLSLTAPSGITQNFDYLLTLINTPNTSNPTASADYVVFPTEYPSTSFSIGGTDYTLLFSGFGSISGGGFSSVNQFHVLEGSSASAQLIGTITKQINVPEPATLLLLGSGLVGLAIARRKMK